jgi:hypothetical protein
MHERRARENLYSLLLRASVYVFTGTTHSPSRMLFQAAAPILFGRWDARSRNRGLCLSLLWLASTVHRWKVSLYISDTDSSIGRRLDIWALVSLIRLRPLQRGSSHHRRFLVWYHSVWGISWFVHCSIVFFLEIFLGEGVKAGQDLFF